MQSPKQHHIQPSVLIYFPHQNLISFLLFTCVVARLLKPLTFQLFQYISKHALIDIMQMRADIQVLSPLVPVREVTFLRFCKQHAQGVWAVVDVSIDNIRGNSSSTGEYIACQRLPSGCIVQDMSNGCSKVHIFSLCLVLCRGLFLYTLLLILIVQW